MIPALLYSLETFPYSFYDGKFSVALLELFARREYLYQYLIPVLRLLRLYESELWLAFSFLIPGTQDNWKA